MFLLKIYENLISVEKMYCSESQNRLSQKTLFQLCFLFLLYLKLPGWNLHFFSVFLLLTKGDEGCNISKATDRNRLFLLKIKIKQKSACQNNEYNGAFKHFHQDIRAYPRSQKNLHWPIIGKMLHFGKNEENFDICGEPRSDESFAIFTAFKLGNSISST